MELPVFRTAVLNIGTKDVFHYYAIVPMRVQQDAIPGKKISMWFTPVKPMETFVVCAQLCGEGHANMIGTMEAIPVADFDSWARGQSVNALKAHQMAAEAATASVTD